MTRDCEMDKLTKKDKQAKMDLERDMHLRHARRYLGYALARTAPGAELVHMEMAEDAIRAAKKVERKAARR